MERILSDLKSANICHSVPAGSHSQNMEELSAALKNLPHASEVDEILLPGERGDRVHAQRSRDGIPVPKSIWNKLVGLAERYDLPIPAPVG